MNGIIRKAKAVAKIWRYRESVRRFLNFYESPAAAQSGAVYPQELEFLQELVVRAGSLSGEIIEIGTLFGFTTQHIALWKSSDQILTTVDNFSWNPIGMTPAAHLSFTSRILFYVVQKCNVRIFAGTNTDFHAQFAREKPALIFIDAGHTYEEVMVDIRWAVKMQIPIICGHDYGISHPGVKRAVDEVFGKDIKVVGTLWAHIPKPAQS